MGYAEIGGLVIGVGRAFSKHYGIEIWKAIPSFFYK